MKILTLIISVLSLSSCIAGGRSESLNTFLDSLYTANPNLVGIIVNIRDKEGDLLFDKAYGHPSIEKDEALNSDDPLLIASMTKSYVAASTVKLVEMEELGLDHPISMYLSARSTALLQDGGYDPTGIEIRHLLSHRSGIADYVDSAYFAFAKANPRYRWTRDEQIERAMEARKADDTLSLGDFRYGDINYILLAEIIENIRGKAYNKAISELLRFEELGIENTWFPTIDKGEPIIAVQYSGKDSINSAMFDPSWDLYGGGGLAATASDVNLFLSKLFGGEIIRDKDLLKAMVTPINPESSNYALGFRIIGLPDATLYYHGGYWGTDMFHSPESGISVAIFLLNKDYQNSLGPKIGMKVFDTYSKR